MNALPLTAEISSRGNARIFAELRRPTPSLGTLVVCHGIGEHAGRYARFVGQLHEAGITTLVFDLRGHGKSDGRRGHVDAFSDYLEDLHCVLAWYCEATSDEPMFLFGHSLGAVVATEYLLNYAPLRPIRGLLLSSPAFVPAMAVPGYKALLSRLLLPLWPTLRFATGIRSEQLSSDADAQRAFDLDPKTYSKVSLRWYTEFRRATIDCLQRASELSAPMYVCVGAADGVVSPDGARCFLDAATSSDKTLRSWDGLLHEPLNEPDGTRVARTMIEWIVARATPP